MGLTADCVDYTEFSRRAASLFILTQRHSVSRSFSLLLTGCTNLPDHHPIGMIGIHVNPCYPCSGDIV